MLLAYFRLRLPLQRVALNYWHMIFDIALVLRRCFWGTYLWGATWTLRCRDLVYFQSFILSAPVLPLSLIWLKQPDDHAVAKLILACEWHHGHCQTFPCLVDCLEESELS